MNHRNPEGSVKFKYTNYKGVTSLRQVVPICIEHKSTEHHPEPQWIMTAYDLVKMEERCFAMRDMKGFDWNTLKVRAIPFL